MKQYCGIPGDNHWRNLRVMLQTRVLRFANWTKLFFAFANAGQARQRQCLIRKPMEKPYQLKIVLRINFYRINSHCSSSWLGLRLENAGNSPPAPLASQLGDVAILYLWYKFSIRKTVHYCKSHYSQSHYSHAKILSGPKKNYLAFPLQNPCNCNFAPRAKNQS